MDAHSELRIRLALKRRRKLGNLSDAGFHELEDAVGKDPASFVDDPEEEAFAALSQALDVYDAAQADDDLLDDQQYAEARTKRLTQLHASCQQIAAIDSHCVDARTIGILSADGTADATLDALLDLRDEEGRATGPIKVPAAGDAWSDVFSRPRLRLEDAIARCCVDTARFGMARSTCSDLLAVAPLDALGARYTCALVMARLEDEEGFEWLDARFSRHGNAWFHIARTLLLYKLDRLPAARRALHGLDQLVTGAAYALLQPVYIDTYMPDRPGFQPGSFQEATLAVHEADPIIADVPDFAAWAASQPAFSASAHGFADANGLDWREPGEL